jgi:hypothetical protein
MSVVGHPGRASQRRQSQTVEDTRQIAVVARLGLTARELLSSITVYKDDRPPGGTDAVAPI